MKAALREPSESSGGKLCGIVQEGVEALAGNAVEGDEHDPSGRGCGGRWGNGAPRPGSRSALEQTQEGRGESDGRGDPEEATRLFRHAREA